MKRKKLKKLLHIYINHNNGDQPYLQSNVKSNEKKILEFCKSLNADYYLEEGPRNNGWTSYDDFIRVYHTFELTLKQKDYLANVLVDYMTLKKNEMPNKKIIRFYKDNINNYWIYE